MEHLSLFYLFIFYLKEFAIFKQVVDKKITSPIINVLFDNTHALYFSFHLHFVV